MNGLSNDNSLGDLNNLMAGANGIPNLEGLMGGMSGLFENMGSDDTDGEMPDLNNLFSSLMSKSNLNNQSVKNAQSKSKLKKQLRDKLKEKKALLKKQEEELKLQINNETYIEKDLDDLVREIEGVGQLSASVKKKKKKKKKKSKNINQSR